MLCAKKWVSAALLGCGLWANSAAADELKGGPPQAGCDALGRPVPCPRTEIVGGAGVELVRPFFQRNPVWTITTGVGTPNVTVDQQEFDWNYRPAVTATLGVVDPSGRGLRGNFYMFDHGSRQNQTGLDDIQAATTTILPPVNLAPQPGLPPRRLSSPGILLQGGRGADTLVGSSDLRVQWIDAEATYSVLACNMEFTLAGGARYMQFAQNYRLELQNIVGAASENSTLLSGQNFYGGGPTIAFTTRGCLANSRFGLFSTVRGTLLAGTSRNDSYFRELVVDPGAAGIDTLGHSKSRSYTTVPALEIELGAEYSVPNSRMPIFLRASVVDRTFFDVGNASQRNGNLSLFGAHFGIGASF